MPYAIRHHTADLALEVSAESLPEFFRLLVRGIGVLYAGPGIRLRAQQTPLTLTADSLERLTVRLANEVIFRFDAQAQLVHDLADITVVQEPSGDWLLAATPVGMAIGEEMKQDADLKAATYHGLEVKQSTAGNWFATLIIDT